MSRSFFSAPTFLASLRCRTLRWFLMALAVGCFGAATARAAAAPAVPLHTSGQFIVDSNGTRVHINAFNWYGSEGLDYVVEGLQAQPSSSIVGTIKGRGFHPVRLFWSTTETGNGGGFNTVETYGVLNTAWSGAALAARTSRLESMMTAAGPGVNPVPAGGKGMAIPPGGSGSTTVTIVPANGFTGTVDLSCTVSGPTGATNLPQCSVPASETITANSTAIAIVSITTTATTAKNAPGGWLPMASGVAAAGFLVLLGNVRRCRFSFWSLLMILAIAFPLQACGGGNIAGTTTYSPGITADTYAVTVTASATGITR